MSGLVAPDGRTLLIRTTAGAYETMALGDGSSSPARGVLASDRPIAWTTDSRALVVRSHGPAIPARLERVDPLTGARRVLTELSPPDREGVVGMGISQWIDDGTGYVYNYTRDLSTLFVVSGVK